MSEIHINNVFPTPVMRVEKFLDTALIDVLVNDIRQNRQQKNAHSDLLSHSEVIHPDSNSHYHTLGEQAAPFIRDFGFLLFGENLEWSIKEIWMNILSTGGHQMMHNHANSFISGVVYLTECHSSTHTLFHREMGARQFNFSNAHADSAITAYNAERWAASDVERGDLLLFPSYMLHAVPENEGKERITVAFNALPARLKSWDYEVKFSS